MATTANSSSRVLLTLALVIIIAVGVFYFINGKDHRTTGDKVGDAINTFSDTKSLGKATDQLGDRTPAQQTGDALERKGDEIKNDLKQ